MTCLILSTAVQCRQSKARKTLPVPVGERHRQGLGSVSDHRTYHTPFRTTRKQHGQRGPKMKWSGAETAKNGRKYSKKVSGAGSHCRGRRFESDQVHHVGASFVSLAPTYFISQSALTPLLLLSKPQPLHWVAVWGHRFAAVLFFSWKISFLTVPSTSE